MNHAGERAAGSRKIGQKEDVINHIYREEERERGMILKRETNRGDNGGAKPGDLIRC